MASKHLTHEVHNCFMTDGAQILSFWGCLAKHFNWETAGFRPLNSGSSSSSNE